MAHTTPTLASAHVACFHCGEDCAGDGVADADKSFCCSGCLAVYQLLTGSALSQYYREGEIVGRKPTGLAESRFAYLDEPAIIGKALLFQSESQAKIILSIPQIHCASCIWLLEHLYMLHPAIVHARAELTTRALHVTFDPSRISLRKLVELLASLGYEPSLSLESVGRQESRPSAVRLYSRLGVAFFAFANVMLFALPDYFTGGQIGSERLTGLFRFVSLGLAIPVLLFSATDYFTRAWIGLSRGVISLDVPLAIGIGMLFVRSAWDILSGSGPGYLDSFTGLVFFLLLGQLFQHKLYDHLSFDRDYRSYFPISCQKQGADGSCAVHLSSIGPGDRVLVRHNEIVPADAVVISGTGSLDYSFVTGESAAKQISSGDRLFSGGRVVNGAVEIELIRSVNESYLISLWSDPRMQRTDKPRLHALAQRIAAPFTAAVLLIAAITGIYWQLVNPDLMIHAVTSVLLVACPCALALAGPFIYGTAMRHWGEQQLFVRNAEVVEHLASVNRIVFDKTGTLTAATPEVAYLGEKLQERELQAIVLLLHRSTHPHARAIARSLACAPAPADSLQSFDELVGSGILGQVDGHSYRIGKRSFVMRDERTHGKSEGTEIYLSIDNRPVGRFVVTPTIRTGLQAAVNRLLRQYPITILTGDTSAAGLLADDMKQLSAATITGCSPHDKLEAIDQFQKGGDRVLMIGDGLNDAGALKHAAVGIAVLEDQAGFTPAADGIIAADKLSLIASILHQARATRPLLIACYLFSLLYNIAGLTFAVTGHLTPIVSAILMPLSSISIVLTAVIGTRLICRRNEEN